MTYYLRKALSALLCFALITSLLQLVVSNPDQVNAEGTGEEFVMPDTTVYRFGASTGLTVDLVGDANAAPKVTQATYGVKIETTAADSTRTFEFNVAQAGSYIVKLGGMTATDGGTAQVSLDGKPYEEYSFYSVNGSYPRPDLYVKQLPLSSGKHTLTFTLKAPGNGAGNGTGTALYPLRLTLTDLATVTNSKSRATYFTPAKVAAARENVQQYSWAAALKDDVMAKADAYAALSYEQLWNLVPSQAIPRSYNTNQLTGNLSPVSGDLKAYGNYPWKADPLNEPWKIVDPASGYKFPTNDFGAYYRSGLDAHGNFNPSLADRNLLVNTLYPEKGPTWGVDDGYGWVDPATNKRYTFIAYYAHWFAWYGGTAAINNAINALQNAYVYTGDMKYARAGAVMLDRIADVYPSMDVAQFNRNIYVNSHGGTGDGKVVGSIWETGLVKSFISAYDSFFQTYDDPEVVAFLSSKGKQYDLPLKNNGSEIRRNIEDGILRQVQPGMYWNQIRGNNGFHQSAMAMAAVVHDTMPETKQWLDYTFQPGGFINQIPRRVTGGNVLFSMVNDVDRDGNGNEAGPGYNRLWLNTYLVVADVLDGYDKYPAADLYNNVKFRKMFQAMYPLLMVGKYTPSIGDSGTTGQPGIYANQAQSIKAFEKFGDPVYAQLAYMLNGDKTDGIHSDVFTANPEQVARNIEAVVQSHGPLDMGSVNMTGYGFAGLRDGKPAAGPETVDTRRAAWMYYGRTSGHGHRDMLNLGLYGFGLDLLPDLGYPEQANATDVNRFEWVSNTISHNTVVVDKQKQLPQWDGTPKHYDDSSMVKLIDVAAPETYASTQVYNRTSAMVKVDEANSYVADFFRVQGGNDHHFSFHAAEGAVTPEGLTLTPQETGSYAGPDIEYGKRPANDSVSGSGYTGSGFHWLKNVERDSNPSSQFSVDWDVVDTWRVLPQPEDIHVKLTMLGDVDDVALADGVPPQNKPGNPKSVKYLIAHRSGENLNSTFTSVVEPYKGERLIRSISAASVSPGNKGGTVNENRVRAIKVELMNGRTDYIVSSMDPDAEYTIDGTIRFQGAFGIYSEKDGQRVFTYVNDGAYIGKSGTASASAGVGRLQGTVADFTKELSVENSLTVKLDLQGLQPDSLAGTSIYVQNDGKRNAVYEIKGVKTVGTGLYELQLGDITPIRAYVDSNDLSKGFIYDVSEGAAFTIPLSRQQQWLSEVKIISPKTELNKNETVDLVVKGYYSDGTKADLTGHTIKINSENPSVANVNEEGRLKAHITGTTTLTTTVELNGVKRQGSLTVTVK